MLKIRLQRVGRKHEPAFRVVVVDSRRAAKAGTAVDRIGFYNPAQKLKKVDGEKARRWLSVGAQASGTVHNLLVNEGVIKGKKINVLPKKRPIAKEEAPKEAKAPEEQEPKQTIQSSTDNLSGE